MIFNKSREQKISKILKDYPELSFSTKYKVGDKKRVCRMAGHGIATVTDIANSPNWYGNIGSYKIMIEWDDKHRDSHHEISKKAFEEEKCDCKNKNVQKKIKSARIF